MTSDILLYLVVCLSVCLCYVVVYCRYGTAMVHLDPATKTVRLANGSTIQYNKVGRLAGGVCVSTVVLKYTCTRSVVVVKYCNNKPPSYMCNVYRMLYVCIVSHAG